MYKGKKISKGSLEKGQRILSDLAETSDQEYRIQRQSLRVLSSHPTRPYLQMPKMPR